MCNAVLLHVVVAQYCGLSSCLNVLKALHTQRNDQRFTISPNSLKGSYLNSYKRWIQFFFFLLEVLLHGCCVSFNGNCKSVGRY